MDIPQALPQCTDTKTLIVASGAQVGKVYFAQNGVIELVHAFEEQAPGYTDNEGHFDRPSAEGVSGGGAPREVDSGAIRKQYVQTLVTGLERMVKEPGVDVLYLFAPDYMQNELQAAMPRALRDKLVNTYGGNLVEAHPTELLERLKDEAAIM